MGHGIAYVAALAGCEVALNDSRADALPQARAKIDELLAGAVKRGKLTDEGRVLVAGRLHVERVLADVRSGYVSVAAARAAYGVAIRQSGREFKLDLAATADLRGSRTREEI